jgi:hypothetical protein
MVKAPHATSSKLLELADRLGPVFAAAATTPTRSPQTTSQS